jgi:hypothetical protein
MATPGKLVIGTMPRTLGSRVNSRVLQPPSLRALGIEVPETLLATADELIN